MTFIKLQFRPGINRDQTDYTGEGGWYAGDKVRFRSGFPEKIGGWTRDGSNTFLGTCRQMWSWITTFSDNFLGVGTNLKLYIQNGLGGSYYDITPLRATNPTYVSTATNNCIYTTSGSNVVRVTLTTDPSALAGNYVDISGAISTPFTVGFTNGSANITGTNLPAVGTLVQFATTGSLPTNFVTGTTYYVVSNTSGTTITVSSILGGTAIVAGSAGSGTQTLIGTIGGIPISEFNASQLITSIPVSPANSFTFQTTTVATSTVAGGGGTGITVSFEIDTGYASATAGYGWGTSTWSRGTWSSTSDKPILLPQQDWWMDNFDNDLVANIRNGAPYYWQRGSVTDPTTSLGTRAITLSAYAYNWATATAGLSFTPAQYRDAAPTKVGQLLVSQQDKHLLAFGSDFGVSTTFDPLTIRWASQDSPGNWIPETTNSAGFLRVSRGSRIVRALATRQEILIWSDSNLYTLQFLGTTDVFGLQEYADNISIASPRSVAVASNIVFWMGQDKFYAYTGRVETLPCTLRNHVFMNINFDQADQIICGTNEQWNEIWWFYPTEDSNWNNAYVIYNYLDKVWYYGTIERTAWLDTPLRHWPQAANTSQNSTTGRIYNHENGIDDDGIAMSAYIQSNDFDLENGEQFILTRRIIPDIDFSGSIAPTVPASPQPTVTLEIKSRNFPGSAFNTNTDDTSRVITTDVSTYTGQVFLRARARQMALTVRSSDLVTQWQLGSPRLDFRLDGKR
jgi:hypothetical protein